jgi:hypothetical protein
MPFTPCSPCSLSTLQNILSQPADWSLDATSRPLLESVLIAALLPTPSRGALAAAAVTALSDARGAALAAGGAAALASHLQRQLARVHDGVLARTGAAAAQAELDVSDLSFCCVYKCFMYGIQRCHIQRCTIGAGAAGEGA